MQIPALIRAYMAASYVSAPLWHAALNRRAKRGKEDPARLSERWGHPASPAPTANFCGCTVSAWAR